MAPRPSRRREARAAPTYCIECHRLLAGRLPGRCDACARRVSHGVALPDDARCLACGVSDRRVLAWELLAIERVVLCFNDAARLRCTGPAVSTVREALERLADVVGDRRQGDRRTGPLDRRPIAPPPPPAVAAAHARKSDGRRAVDRTRQPRVGSC